MYLLDLNKKDYRDWTALPDDIINYLSEFLPLRDRIWFRKVCKRWYSAIPNLPVHGPWLLLPGDGSDFGEYTNSFTFYSIFNKTTFKVPFFPLDMKLSGMHCVGSRCGWLVMCDLYFNICLVNPLTGVRFDLPPFSTCSLFELEYTTAEDGTNVLSGFRDYRIGDDDEGPRSFNRKDCYIQKIVFREKPGHTDFCVVALFGNGYMASYSPNRNSWLDYHDPTITIQDVVFSKNYFWAITGDSRVISFTFYGSHYGCVDYQITHDPVFDTHKFIVFSRDDHTMYMILRNGDFQIHSDGKRKFHTKSLTVMKSTLNVFKDGAVTGSWELVEDLNGESMFIGNTNGISYSRQQYRKLRSNCVYITSIPIKDEVFDMGVYDMEKKRFEPFYPNDMELNWAQPPPILFEPFLK